MKIVIISVICRLIAYISVLAFVYGVVAVSGNPKYLWLLALLITCELVPTYEIGHKDNEKDD